LLLDVDEEILEEKDNDSNEDQDEQNTLMNDDISK
jgi:hypothetical protein